MSSASLICKPRPTTPITSTVSAAEVLKLLSVCPNKSSPLDFVPTSLLKLCRSAFSEIIATLANLSFSQGCFPTSFKVASITPLLKKPGLDKSIPSNYRPVSNLNTISKILERLFLSRIQPHVLASPNFNPFQSAYRPKHSTETGLLSVLDNIFHASDTGISTLLVSLDLSAAFDTIDHGILLNRLRTSFGFAGSFYQWIESYLIGRSQFVRIGTCSAQSTSLTTGVPQGSVLGPLLFTIYTSPIASIASSFSVSQQQYADDTQLFLALSQPDYTSDLTNLEKCLADLNYWFCLNGLALNPDKSDTILLGTRQRAHGYSKLTSVDVAGSVVALADHIKILGVTLDSQLTMDRHVNDVCRSAFFHVRALRHIRSAITDDVAKAVACAFVGARLDYANSVLYGVSSKNIARLQRMQNALARVVLGQSASHFISTRSMLKDLHWLPIEYRIKFKIAKLAYNARVSSAPVYLSSLLCEQSCQSISSLACMHCRHTKKFSAITSAIRQNLSNADVK
jgi:hypothetical protein